MRERGKLVILLMLAVAVGLASFAWWYRYKQGDRALAFWGTEAALLIRDAPQVELLWLREADAGYPSPAGDAELIRVDSQAIVVVERFDLSRTRGLIHARHALLENASYQWEQLRSDCVPRWTFGLRFADGPRRITLIFDTACQRVRRSGGDEEAAMNDTLQKLQQFCAKNFPPTN